MHVNDSKHCLVKLYILQTQWISKEVNKLAALCFLFAWSDRTAGLNTMGSWISRSIKASKPSNKKSVSACKSLCVDIASCRCPDPGAGIPASNAACFLVPDVDARGNTVTHGFILVPAAGPDVQQRGVRGHCIILHQRCL